MATLDLPPDPSIKDLRLPWEAQYWYKASWEGNARALETFEEYFRPERKPRDIFRSDVAEFRTWLRKKGMTDNTIHKLFDIYGRFYRFLQTLELVEADFNPFEGMAPKRITVNPR